MSQPRRMYDPTPATPSLKLPHSEESERAVLSALLLEPNLMPEVAGRLVGGAKDFYFDRHQRIYQAMLDLGEFDLRTLQAKLEQRDELGLVGGLSYLMGMDVDLPDLSRVDQYADVVRERAVRRDLIDLATEVYRNCLDGGMEAPEAIAHATRRVEEIREGAVRPQGMTMAQALEIAELREADAAAVISTGFRSIDEVLDGGGLCRSNLAVIAGRPGMGKSSLAMDICISVAERGMDAWFYSMEMPEWQLSSRAVSARSGVSKRERRRGLTGGDVGLVARAKQDLAGMPFRMVARSKIRASQIEAEVRAARKKPSVVAIDYLQLLVPDLEGRYTTDEKISDQTRRLKAMALATDSVVLLLSQLNREVEKRPDKRPTSADLRASGAIEQDADVIAFCYRPSRYEDLRRKGGFDLRDRLILDKNREGETGDVIVEFQQELTRWVDPKNNPLGQDGLDF